MRSRRREVVAPVVEGRVDVGGRRLGFAEFGDPSGHPVFWLHGTPGASRQLAPLAKEHAAENGIRVIGLERPGVGSSHPHRYERVVDFAHDVALLGLAPVADLLFLGVYAVMGSGDRRVLDMPGVKDMFIDDILRGVQRGGAGAILQDVVLFGRDWGFRVREIETPVYWWHGDADFIVPYAHGRHMADLLPACTFVEQPGESHLSGYIAADEVLESVCGHLR